MSGFFKKLCAMFVAFSVAAAATPLCATAATICYNNGECGPGNFCSKPVGTCGGSGTCAASPQMCITLWNPVCGCNNRTYGNSCEASGAGVSVAGETECSIHDVYANAPDGGMVYARNVGYGEQFIADLPKTVTLMGGYDTASQGVAGNSTFHAMLIYDGTLDVRNVILQ